MLILTRSVNTSIFIYIILYSSRTFVCALLLNYPATIAFIRVLMSGRVEELTSDGSQQWNAKKEVTPARRLSFYKNKFRKK